MIENISIPHKLNISNPEDRQALLKAAAGMPTFLSLIEEQLDRYLTMFPEPQWHTIYSGGMIVVGQKKHSRSYDLCQMLELIKSLKDIEKYSDFATLMSGFRNQSQIAATMFEVDVAVWCVNRKMTQSLEFSPSVYVKGHVKHPDFLWHTELGRLYVECKTSEAIETNFMKRASKLTNVLNAAHKANEPWDSAYRLDVTITTTATNQIEQRIKDVVAQASLALKSGNLCPFKNGEVSGVLHKREESPPHEDEIIRSSSINVGTTATAISHKNSHTTFTMSLAKYRGRATRDLIHEARTQLPEDYPSAIFIKLGGPISARRKAEKLLVSPEYERTPWIGIWTPAELRVIWRNGQPFDGRLLLGRGESTGSTKI